MRGMSRGDRIFWSIMLFIFVELMWLKLLDPIVGMAPALVVGIAVVGGFIHATRPIRKADSGDELA